MSLSGRVAVVTGANSGIGEVTARELARMGAKVVATARDEAKGRAAIERIKSAVPSADVTLELADFSSQKSARAFAARVAAAHPKIHVLVNNAGAFVPERHVTEDGLELSFAANHLGYFLTTTLLLDRVKAAAPSRVVVVASEAHRGKTIPWDDLDASKGYSAIDRYGSSKLANVLFAAELSRRLEGTGVTANSLHPGVIATNFGNGSWWMRLGISIIKPFLLDADQGAATQIHLASSPDVEGETGLYWDKKKPSTPSKEAQDTASQKRLWELSEELVKRSA